MDINNLIEKAKTLNGFKSDRQVAIAIGISEPSFLRVRRGHGHLNDDNMIKLGSLAGLSETESLLLLNVWRSTGAAKEAYTGMLKRFAFISLSVLTILIINPSLGQASVKGATFNTITSHSPNYTLSHQLFACLRGFKKYLKTAYTGIFRDFSRLPILWAI